MKHAVCFYCMVVCSVPLLFDTFLQHLEIADTVQKSPTKLAIHKGYIAVMAAIVFSSNTENVLLFWQKNEEIIFFPSAKKSNEAWRSECNHGDMHHIPP